MVGAWYRGSPLYLGALERVVQRRLEAIADRRWKIRAGEGRGERGKEKMMLGISNYE